MRVSTLIFPFLNVCGASCQCFFTRTSSRNSSYTWWCSCCENGGRDEETECFRWEKLLWFSASIAGPEAFHNRWSTTARTAWKFCWEMPAARGHEARWHRQYRHWGRSRRHGTPRFRTVLCQSTHFQQELLHYLFEGGHDKFLSYLRCTASSSARNAGNCSCVPAKKFLLAAYVSHSAIFFMRMEFQTLYVMWLHRTKLRRFLIWPSLYFDLGGVNLSFVLPYKCMDWVYAMQKWAKTAQAFENDTEYAVVESFFEL